ncbi:hypothetical protein [Microbacterium sp.]|uniref:hypothetical protein n=1 Tax=Microbacterium sp. TaxID=51671 RepID=UPI0039E31682
MSTNDEHVVDAALFARLRSVWETVDPMPVDLVDRMVATIAVEDLTREYALLTLVEGSLQAVRSDAETLTVQFSDGTTSVLLHVSANENGTRRIDGWADAPVLAVKLLHDDHEAAAEIGDNGRFAFDDARPGISRLRLAVRSGDGIREFQTPLFEV